MSKTIAIIGAGTAGLAAGCYAQMSGFQTHIFEQGATPGGCCTSWKRKGYTVDTCIHWLVGTNPDKAFYSFWEELGAIQGREIINHEAYARVEGPHGELLVLYADIDRLTSHLLELAPEDRALIRQLSRAMHKCAQMPMPLEKAPEVYGPLDIAKTVLRMLPYGLLFSRWKNVTLQELAQRFKNPWLRRAFGEALATAFGDNPQLPMLPVLMTFGMLHQKMAGYPVGGSLPFARAIERRYQELGGEISYGAGVKSILVEHGTAQGVVLEDGTEHRADIVISAADGHATLFDMLGERFVDDRFRGYYAKLPTIPSLVQVALGVDGTFPEMPRTVTGITFAADPPLQIGGLEQRWLTVQAYTFDSTLAPEGKTFFKVVFTGDYAYWKKLREDKESYRAQKDQAAAEIIAQIDRRFPGFADKVEMIDVATPVSFERYTGNWKGAYMGWLVTKETFGLMMPKTLPGVRQLYLTGQWVEPGGGLPTAVKSGRNVVQLICRDQGRLFVPRRPARASS